jgi:hypothetical protein
MIELVSPSHWQPIDVWTSALLVTESRIDRAGVWYVDDDRWLGGIKLNANDSGW